MIKLYMVPKLSLGSAQPQLIMINIQLLTAEFVENMLFCPYTHPYTATNVQYQLSYCRCIQMLFIGLSMGVDQGEKGMLSLPSSAPVSDSAELSWSLISILPHPTTHPPRESINMVKFSQT